MSKVSGRRLQQFSGMTLNDFRGGSNTEARGYALDYLENLKKNRDSGKGLTFIGPPGVGKSMLASLLLNEIKLVNTKYRVTAVEMARFIKYFQTMFKTQKLMEEGEPDALVKWWEASDMLDWIEGKFDFVLFDDVGKEYDSGSGWSNSEFDYYFRARYNSGLPFFITSNLPINQWAGRYSESMESFLHEATTIIVMSDIDHRKN